MGRCLGSLFIVFVSSLCLLQIGSFVAFAYVPTVSSEGRAIHWNNPVKVKLIGNPKNQSGLSPSQFFNAVVTGLQRWKAASQERVSFDYWQGEDNAIYPTNSNYDGYSSIYFSSGASSEGS